jgi:predicted nucleic acid-binding Zn ribbon protein
MWIEAIVMPRESPRVSRSLSLRGRGTRAAASSPAPDRARLHAAGCEEGRRFRDAVLGFLQARHLMSAVRWISEPGTLPQVTLHCTQVVLEQLRQAPEFEAGLSMHLEFLA